MFHFIDAFGKTVKSGSKIIPIGHVIFNLPSAKSYLCKSCANHLFVFDEVNQQETLGGITSNAWTTPFTLRDASMGVLTM